GRVFVDDGDDVADRGRTLRKHSDQSSSCSWISLQRHCARPAVIDPAILADKGHKRVTLFDVTVEGGRLRCLNHLQPESRSDWGCGSLFLRRVFFRRSEFERDRFRALRLLYASAVASAAQELVPALWMLQV